jgi:hypothetical protein
VKIADLGAQTAKATGAAVLGMADPQANVIARMTGLELETVQTSLMLFVALLIEIGSGFGMYVAFAYWRPHTPLHGPAQPASRTTQTAARKEETHAASQDETLPVGKPDPIWSSDPAASGANGETAASGPPAVRPLGDNDNKTAAKWIMPESDVELFYKQGVVEEDSVSIVSQDLYDGYKIWAKGKEKRPLNHSRFSEDFERLGHKTVQVGGRQRYVGITLASDLRAELEKKASFRRRRAQQASEPAVEQPRPAVDEAAAAADQLRAAARQMRAALGEPEATPDKAKAA